MTAYSLQFTEEMKGFFALNEADFQPGFDEGKRAKSSLMFHLTIETEDVRRFIDDRDHVATARGWVGCDVLGGQRPVERGVFNLFVDDSPDGNRKRMLYRLWFSDGVGHPLTMSGFKDIHPAGLTRVWPETSTLYTRIESGHVEEGGDAGAPLIGAGILHILPADFAKQLTTFRVGGPDVGGRLSAFAAFGELFMGQLWQVFKPSLWRR